MKLRDAIEKRQDIKRFDLKTPNWRAIIRAIDAARFAPTAGNQFSTRFILITDAVVIKKLSEASQQSFVGKAKSVVVVVSDNSALIRSYGERGEKYSSHHVGAAIENFLLALEEEKLVTSWVWYFVDEQVKNILEIPEKVVVEGIFPIGRLTKITSGKKRSEKLDNILYFGKYGEREMTPSVVVGRNAS